MKIYDFDKMKMLIEEYKNKGLVNMRAGMLEDWTLTSAIVWDRKNGHSNAFTSLRIRGIPGSHWATPTIELKFEDGSTLQGDCYVSKDKTATDDVIAAMKAFAFATQNLKLFRDLFEDEDEDDYFSSSWS